MKINRHSVIRQLIASQPIASQDDLRRLLLKRGYDVTQATLSRDVHELGLYKGPTGYQLPGAVAEGEEEELPAIEDLLRSFGLRVRQAQNQLVLQTTDGSAQPVALAIDNEGWEDVVGTIAGDNTILIICPDNRRAIELRHRLEAMIG
jgi:transcriptional regulator of arginine metabolism